MEKIRQPAKEKGLPEQTDALWKQLEALASSAAVRQESLGLDILNKVRQLFRDLQQVDAAPTSQQLAAVETLAHETPAALERWKKIPPEVATLNARLKSAGITPMEFP